jgi:hypothetical protein
VDRIITGQNTYPSARHPATCGLGAEGEGEMTGPRRAGRAWTLTDDDQLRKLLVSGMKVTVIARKMERSVGAIYARKNSLKVKAK